MRPQTEFRLAMLRNGFAPVLNDCKRSVEQDWPRKAVNEAEIVSWDRSALLSTGMRVDGDLAVIDVDVSEAALRSSIDVVGQDRRTRSFTERL